MLDNTAAPCPLCGASGSRLFFQSRGKRLKRQYLLCAHCALVWVPAVHRLSPGAEKARYDLHQNNPEDTGYRRHLRRLVTPLIAALPAGATGLDFGSGPSPVLQSMLVAAGYPTDSYDPFYAPYPSLLRQHYHFVTATEVVEHLHHPGAELDALWRLLNLNGILAVMTQLRCPHHRFADWHYKNDPTHVAFFAKASLDYLGARWGVTPAMVAPHVVFFVKSTMAKPPSLNTP